MKISKLVTLTSVVLLGACANVDTDGDVEKTERESSASLAQWAPIDWPDAGNTARDAGRDAGPSTTPAPSPPSGGSGTGPVRSGTNGQANVRDPNGLYFANIAASGGGCPAGSWAADISRDGQTFTLTFSKYQVTLTENDANKDLGCIINITFDSPNGLSYGVTDLSYSGYAFLEKGVTANHTAYYSFTGQATTVDGTRVRRTRQDFTGPYDQGFTFTDTLRTQDVVFSECGVKRTLNLRSSLSVRNGSPRAEGYINLASLDGTTQGKLILKLALRRC